MKLFMIILVTLLFFIPEVSEAHIYILVDQPSDKQFPVAVDSLQSRTGKESKAWSKEVTEKIQNDLELTGLFEFIHRAHFPKSEEAHATDPQNIKLAAWTLIGAQALINGSYQIGEEAVDVTLNLYDPFLGQHLLEKKYQTQEKDISIIAHHFADEVMQALTGERGVFSTKVAFVCQEGKHKEICTMDMDGGNLQRLTKDRSINISPAWSPSGRELAFTSFKVGENPEINVINNQGKKFQVTSNENINLSPAWSPRGHLTVASAVSGDTELYIVNRQGRFTRQLTRSFGIDINPSWSPDGQDLVFASERAGRLHLFRSKANGAGLQRLTFVGYYNDNPVWSPRGDKIVFQSMDMGNWDLFIMNADGSLIQRLTNDTGNNEGPSWSPNGRFITFSSDRKGSPHIYIMREDGANQTLIGPKGIKESTQPDWGPRLQ